MPALQAAMGRESVEPTSTREPEQINTGKINFLLPLGLLWFSGLTTPASMRSQPLRTHLLDPRKPLGSLEVGFSPSFSGCPSLSSAGRLAGSASIEAADSSRASVPPAVGQALRSPYTVLDWSPSMIAMCDHAWGPTSDGYNYSLIVLCRKEE